jgi:uncharacterized membrane protein
MRSTSRMKVALLTSWVVFILGYPIQAQGPGGGGMGRGHCPMCGRQWDGNNHYTPSIPDSLAAPDDTTWLNRLDGVMARERLSRAQYENDQDTYRIAMPYNMVIPQEDDHIEWIGELYAAYGMQAPDSVPPVQETSSGRDALRLAMNLEQELIPEYEWLIEHADTTATQQLLGDILYQTRMHRTMFQHALSMGGMMGGIRRRQRGQSEFDDPHYAQMGWRHMDRWGWGGGFFMMFLWVILIIAAIYIAVRLTQKGAGGTGGATTPPQDSALDILQKRYARGEISKEEFEERRKDLAQ